MIEWDSDMTISVFVSYAREDQAISTEVFEFLNQLGLSVFRDVDRLKGGEDWRTHILSAAMQADLFIFLASTTSVGKPGMIQDELNVARSRLDAGLTMKFVAVCTDQVPLPDWMARWQFLRKEDHSLWEKLADIVSELLQLNGRRPILADGSHAFINQDPATTRYETKECEFRYRIPTVSIPGDQEVAKEINNAIRGRVSERILNMRAWCGLDPNYRDGGSMIDIDLLEVELSSENIGVAFEHFAHFATAVHPQHDFLTINLRRRPWSICHLGLQPTQKDRVVELIARELRISEQDPDELVSTMTSLRNFDFGTHSMITKRGIRIFFPDYVLGAYVDGTRIEEFVDDELVALFTDREFSELL